MSSRPPSIPDKRILASAAKTLNTEAKALQESSGRVVVSGIGKSAIIANKIVATLNSTGTPAVFLHAADAIHGDLGMVRREDTVILISNSGNTPEIKVLAPLVKAGGNVLVAMTGGTNSFLANHADYLISSSVSKEACPNNLAPTSSTTAQLALGDALAVCLLELRGFSAEDFARYHPGGALGKRLYRKVDDLWPSNPCPVVHPDTPLTEVILEISSKRLGATAVVDKKKRLMGIITDGDLRRMMARNKRVELLTAADVMTASPCTLPPNTMAVEALALMKEKNITQLLVAEKSRLIGFVHLHDLLREGII
jgi:arabinose-5-phosphate isomerase